MLWLLKIGTLIIVSIVLIRLIPIVSRIFYNAKLAKAMVCIVLFIVAVYACFLIRMQTRNIADRICEEVYEEQNASGLPALDSREDDAIRETEVYQDTKYGGR